MRRVEREVQQEIFLKVRLAPTIEQVSENKSFSLRAVRYPAEIYNPIGFTTSVAAFGCVSQSTFHWAAFGCSQAQVLAALAHTLRKTNQYADVGPAPRICMISVCHKNS